MIFNEELFDKHSNQTAVITSENKIFKYNDLLFCSKDIKKIRIQGSMFLFM